MSRTRAALQASVHEARMIGPIPARAEIKALIDFYTSINFEVAEIDSLVSKLEKDGFDLKAAHKTKRAVSLKLCAEEMETRARQLSLLAGHLAEVAAKNVNRNPRTNQE